MDVDLRVFDDSEALAEAAAKAIAAWLAEESSPSFGLAGGSTPIATYRRLVEVEGVPWERVTAWLGDERFVPTDHPDSNSRMVAEELVAHLPGLSFHPIPWQEGVEPHHLAAAYEASLTERGALEEPTLVLLGMGPDGHTCSLFPGTAALAEDRRLYVANRVPQLQTWRLTATYRLLQRARRLVFLVGGSSKAEMVRAVLEEGADYPARTAHEVGRDVVWFLDRAAASELS